MWGLWPTLYLTWPGYRAASQRLRCSHLQHDEHVDEHQHNEGVDDLVVDVVGQHAVRVQERHRYARIGAHVHHAAVGRPAMFNV